jgi:hypothetical protein
LPQGLQALQPRIVAWLGRIGGATDLLADAGDASPSAGGGTRWDPADRLGLDVAFEADAAPLRVYLDELLPQVTPVSLIPIGYRCPV